MHTKVSFEGEFGIQFNERLQRVIFAAVPNVFQNYDRKSDCTRNVIRIMYSGILCSLLSTSKVEGILLPVENYMT